MTRGASAPQDGGEAAGEAAGGAAAGAAARACATTLRGPILALDTSTDSASLALVTPEGVHTRGIVARALPSEAVMPALVALLQAHGLAPRHLRALVVGLGPGSFTGLRVGLATLKGLGYAASLPLYGSSSLAMLAAATGPGRVAVLRDARRGSAYLGAYDVDEAGAARPFAEDSCVPVEELADRLATLAGAAALRVVGDATLASSWRELVPLPAPRAELLVVQAAARLARGDADDLASLAPRYLQRMVPPGPRA